MTYVFSYILLLISFLPGGSDHALYLSVLEVDITDEVCDIQVKVFEDDMRDALRHFRGIRFDTLSLRDSAVIQAYFDEHLKLKSLGQPIRPHLQSVQLLRDSYQIHLRHAGPITLTSIYADYLMELFGDQQNILHLRRNGDKIFEVFKKGACVWQSIE
ncbi:MAG: DUF6702 family protein [Bacteroidota bacterium]